LLKISEMVDQSFAL